MLDSVFKRTGVDYAGPMLVKCGSVRVRQPTLVKVYVSISLGACSDLTSETFIAALRQFITRHSKPSVI